MAPTMAHPTDSKREAPPGPSPEADPAADVDAEQDEPAARPDEQVWAHSSWDLRQGLDVAELNELPAEWRGIKPR